MQPDRILKAFKSFAGNAGSRMGTMFNKNHRHFSIIILFFTLMFLTAMLGPGQYPGRALGSPSLSTLRTATGPRHIHASRLQEAILAASFGYGIFDDTDNRFVYDGDWQLETGNSDAYQYTLHTSNTVGNSVEFSFTGAGLWTFFEAGPSLGTLRLTLDNESYVMNEASSGTLPYIWLLAASYNGTHHVVITHESGGAVNLDAIQVPGLPTTLTITDDSPDPSEFNQSVSVAVMLRDAYNAPVPNAAVEISGADINCLIKTNSNGTGSCTVIFSTVGEKVITATYQGNANYFGSSDDDPFSVAVRVTGGIITPTGSVDINGGDGVGCTIPLNNGAGNCTLADNTAGVKSLDAVYSGDSLHLPSSASETHTVVNPPPAILSVHISDIDPVTKKAGQGWQALLILAVHDNDHLPVANAAVYGAWFGGYNRSVSCVTNTTGSCIIRSGMIRIGSPVRFTVKNVTHNNVPYLPADNRDPDRDSNGTRITIRR
jgi:hypothetical protein